MSSIHVGVDTMTLYAWPTRTELGTPADTDYLELPGRTGCQIHPAALAPLVYNVMTMT